MLEPHPPHHTPNTWRDFFLHIATIVVGLLIAVGLEQTVEFFHHRHQRSDLLESLRGDTAICEQDGEIMAHQTKLIDDWLRDRQQRINAILWGGVPTTDLPAPLAMQNGVILSYTHFEAAKASGLLQLLNTEDLDAFSDIDFDVELAFDSIRSLAAASEARRAFEASYFDREFMRLDFSKASPADLRQYLRLLQSERTALTDERRRADETAGAAAALLSGQRGIRKLQQAEVDRVLRDFGADPSQDFVVPPQSNSR